MSLYPAITLLTLALLPIFPVGEGQVRSKPSEIRLAVSLEADRTSGTMNDSIVLTILVKNVGREPLFLYGKLAWGMSSSLFLVVTGENGEPVPITYLDDEIPLSPSRGDKSLFIKLNPAHIFGTTRIDRFSRLVPKPGNYYLWVEYHGPFPRRYAAGTPAWGLEDPRLDSNKVKIDVR